MSKISLKKIFSLKKKNIGITSVTSYDASFAKLADECGVDIILVGDSLGEVVQGMKNTHSVTISDICYHTKSVARGIKNAYLVSDMPKNSFNSKRQALANALKIINYGGADMVKIESKPQQVEIIQHLVKNNIRVCGHIGVQPQNIANKKLYKKMGKTPKESNALINQAKDLQDAGAELLVLECINNMCASKIKNILKIPVIGIGSGNDCDGQIRVIYDIFNMSFNGSPGFMNRKRSVKNPLKNLLKNYIKLTKDFK